MTASLTLPDRYRLEGPLAAGGMAAVYAAHDTLLDRRVAVKVLAEYLGTDDAARRRFAREARAAAGLSHHAVVTIYDVGEHDGRSFIVMELLGGGTVADVLRRSGRVEPARALGWLGDIASALDLAHERGIVHRDIKPANLLLDESDRVSVADFGIARLAYEDQVTATGQVLGTAAYISPEQAEGHPATPASDRYALAVVAFELLTGERPFNAEHFAAQARAHIEDEPPSASDRAPGLSAAVDGVLARGMAKDPAARWDTASAFVEALEGSLASRGAVKVGPAVADAETTRVMEPTARRGAPIPSRSGVPVPPPRRPGQRRLIWAALPLGLALAAVALAAVLTGGDEKRQPAAAPARTPAAKRKPAPAATAAQPTPTPAATQAATPAANDPIALNANGFELFKRGDYAAAIPLFAQAVQACPKKGALDPCGYALYNLGASLRRSGDPNAAIPVLEERMKRYGDDDAGSVAKELDAAYEDAGLGQPRPGKRKHFKQNSGINADQGDNED